MGQFDQHLQIICTFIFPGESATHYLVKNTVRTFKELGVRVCLTVNCWFIVSIKIHISFEMGVSGVQVPPARVKKCLLFSAGPEGAEREPDINSGAEQHLSTSGQSEQTSAVHLRFHPAVTGTPFEPSSDPRLLPTKGFYWLLLNNPRCYSVESFTRKCLHVTAANSQLLAGRDLKPVFPFCSSLWLLVLELCS